MLQVTSHKPDHFFRFLGPIIWRIRGLGTPKDLFGGGRQQKRPLGAPPTGWCCKTHSEAHTENAIEFAGPTPETVKIVKGCSEALAHYECQMRNFEIKTDSEGTIPFTWNPQPAFQSCFDNEKHATSLPPQRAAHLSYQSTTHL
jgi:hypothetical protein